ncbi:MAG: response regulator [Thermoanaerobaculia bacterium]|nr:response regulator [Thermoanaerobaculia bacterium]
MPFKYATQSITESRLPGDAESSVCRYSEYAARRFPIDNLDGILLVEDNPADVELTMRALRSAGVSVPVRVAIDGAEAHEILFAQRSSDVDGAGWRPMLVLLDLKLPKIGGLELLEEMKVDERTRTIPTIVFSSSREVADIAGAYRRGANSYVVKPVDYERFQATVAQVAQYWMGLNERPG